MYLNCVVFEERMIEGGLMRDVHAVYDVSIWALLLFEIISNKQKGWGKKIILVQIFSM